MALENAKKFLEQIMNDEALHARVAEKAPEEVAVIARELGFDVTAEALGEAVKTFRTTDGQEPKELTPDELDQAAGGAWGQNEDAPDGHEMGCIFAWHGPDYSRETQNWCSHYYYCREMFSEVLRYPCGSKDV